MLSIPTPDHYLPLLYVLGTKQQGEEIAFPIEAWMEDRYRCWLCWWATCNCRESHDAGTEGERSEGAFP